MPGIGGNFFLPGFPVKDYVFDDKTKKLWDLRVTLKFALHNYDFFKHKLEAVELQISETREKIKELESGERLH